MSNTTKSPVLTASRRELHAPLEKPYLRHEEREAVMAAADAICATPLQTAGLLDWASQVAACGFYLHGLLAGNYAIDSIGRSGEPTFSAIPTSVIERAS